MVLRPKHGLSLCAGGGGLDMGLMLAEPGFHTRCYVEWEEYPRSVLIAAQRAGYFAPAPIWDDLTTFDGRPFRGVIDTILAGYPCQPFSQAGQRRGENDERHLWPDVARVIREIGPRWVFLENVAGHVTLGLETVLRDLWDMGWTPAVGLFSAAETGAPHERLRVFIVAYRAGERHSERRPSGQYQTDAQNGARLVREPERCGGELADAPRGVGRLHAGQGPDWHGTADPRGSGNGLADASRGRLSGPREGQDQQPGRAEAVGSGSTLGNASGIGRGEGRAEPEFRGRRDTASSTGGTMADASGAGLEGRERRRPSDERDGQAASGPVAQRGGSRLFPPGPNDGAAWSSVLAMAPGLAPSVAFGDIARRAQELVAMADQGQLAQAAAESELRRMADGLASRTRALRLLGNGVFSLAAGHAWRALAAAHGLGPVDLVATDRGDGYEPDDAVVRVVE